MKNDYTVKLDIAQELKDSPKAERLRERFGETHDENVPVLRLDENGLSLIADSNRISGDLKKMMGRVSNGKLAHEMLVKAAKIKDIRDRPTAIDATAGLGDDSFLLAAAGFEVSMFERNPIVFELLSDAINRAKDDPETRDIAERMHLSFSDSINAMEKLEKPVDIILLDPMFPERQKSALVKKKLQVIQRIEIPCSDEEELFLAAVKAAPKRLIIKRPPKGPFLAGIKPDFSYTGKAVRFDCFASPFSRLERFIKLIEAT
ncbi:MAG: class I SAM-dependent methyltransferase [Clostridia bacterium]|nr:class I SAM-dependent methyltransferase [Clostridia bacterium]